MITETDETPNTSMRAVCALFCIGLSVWTSTSHAHGISEESKATMSEGGILDYVWLGAEHMVTGYDHLLFLFGVIFFLTSFKDVVRFITAFTVGHCITLLGATMAGITANAYIIDAVIALSVIYKGFENLDGFKKTLKIEAPNLLTMVFIFGLIHGFGLSTRLQELTLGQEGLVSRILAFNVGVELGQIAALTVMLGFFAVWKKSTTFQTFSTAANAALILAGIGLFVMQVDGYMHEGDHHGHHEEVDEHHHGPSETEEPAKATTQPGSDTKDVNDEQTQPTKAETDAAGEAHSHGGEAHSHGKKTHSHGEKNHSHGGEAHSHGKKTHSHGGEAHSHDAPAKTEDPAPTQTDKPTHKHGSGPAHSH